MRIKRKAPKPSARKPALYIVGYTFTSPSREALRAWYDLEYGGPLKITVDPASQERWTITHGPWATHVTLPLPPQDAHSLREGLAWEHRAMATITSPPAHPGTITDTILVAARVARGLTLLTQGTTFDVTTHLYANPSDWQDRSLAYFVLQDHVVTLTQSPEGTNNEEWVYTLGLNKFGVDELETFQPKGLPADDAIELLTEAADEILRTGRSPKVGTQLHLSLLGRTLDVVGHRTAAPAGSMVGFRELRSSPSS